MDKSKKYLKVILLGDEGVGKTAIIKHYVKLSNQDYLSTVNPDFITKQLNIENTNVTLRI